MGNVRYLSLNDGIDEAVVTNQNDCGAEEYVVDDTIYLLLL